MVLVTGALWAQSVEIPGWGTQEFTIIDPGVQWVDDEGVIHIRGRVTTQDLVGEDVYGIPITGMGIVEENFNLDQATGIGDYVGSAHYDYNYGGLVGSLEGVTTGTTMTGIIWEGEYNFPHGGGDFAGWKGRGTFSLVTGNPFSTWEGIWHIPHGGGGGEKSIPADSRTWGSVKALYR
jgi:hypothetical protein